MGRHKLRVGGKQVRLLGCAKGSGMIEPNMATMLPSSPPTPRFRRAALPRACSCRRPTFNSITVDGDTSTNDTVAVLANGQSGARRIANAASADYAAFCAALESVCKSLALAIVADGEGAQRVIEIEVRGAASDRAADQIGAHDREFPARENRLRRRRPQLGPHPRRSRPLRREIQFRAVRYRVAGIEVCRGGREYPFNEITAHEKMLEKHVPIVVDLHAGMGHARLWTCDLTKEYIHINASYRT